MPSKFVCEKVAIMWAVKNISNWFDANHFETSGNKQGAYDAKVKFANTTFGQSFVDYLGPHFYNKLNVEF